MRKTGGVSILTIAMFAMLALIASAFVFARETIGSAGANFMDALSRHDVARLVELSYIGKQDPAAIEAKKTKLKEDWDFAVNTAGKHYTFTWKISATTQSSDSSGTVTLQVTRNAASGSGYDEKYELPMMKEGGNWKVDAGQISREMFPGLPRS
jgi:hypothetical protein